MVWGRYKGREGEALMCGGRVVVLQDGGGSSSMLPYKSSCPGRHFELLFDAAAGVLRVCMLQASGWQLDSTVACNGTQPPTTC